MLKAPTTIRSTHTRRAPTVGAPAVAELETGPSVGTSAPEVKKLPKVRAAPKSAGRGRRAGAGRFWRSWICGPEVTTAPRADPELVWLPRSSRGRIAHIHEGSTALAPQLQLAVRHRRIIDDTGPLQLRA